VHGAAGVVGSMASQLAREAGAYVIGTGRAGGRQTLCVHPHFFCAFTPKVKLEQISPQEMKARDPI